MNDSNKEEKKYNCNIECTKQCGVQPVSMTQKLSGTVGSAIILFSLYLSLIVNDGFSVGSVILALMPITSPIYMVYALFIIKKNNIVLFS
jgi:hypothetical protein